MPDLTQIAAMELTPFFELTPDLVCIAGKEGYFKKVNQSVINKLGYTREELTARPVKEFIHPDDQAVTAAEREKLISGQPLINFQNRYVAKDGTVIWLEWTSIYFSAEEVVFAIAKDITVRKMAELEVEEKYHRVKSLVGHFKGNIERERKYLSVALHEELAQLLAVLKIDIEWIRSKETALPEPVANRLEHAVAVTDLLMKTIQRISFSISPGMLQDLGLVETLRWHCNEFSLISSINCSVVGTCDESSLSSEVQLDLFRICQEALHNVIYHSGATEATVTITETDHELTICVTDNGKGFVVQEQFQTPGLQIMHERAASINAELTLESKPGSGTEVKVTIAK
jgi:PAS domain S-box-containing protein